MKLLAWNIQHGGGTRLARIVEELSAHDADLIALTEYRATPGAVLRKELSDRGWIHFATTHPVGQTNGIAAFSRIPLLRRPSPKPFAGRWLDLELEGCGLSVSILHIMAAGSSKTHPLNIAKTRFWNAALRHFAGRIEEPWILLGDWNTGAHRLDEVGRTYVCAEQFQRLSETGWTDLWRLHNPGRTDWTWYSKRKGGARCNGFRLDHCFASASVCQRVIACRYSHAERDAGVSDHSMTVVELE